jgi:hypothetical protein
VNEYSTRPPPSKSTFPYFEELALSEGPLLAAVLDAVRPKAGNATAEPSASTTVVTAMVRDTKLLLCPGIYRWLSGLALRKHNGLYSTIMDPR